MLNLDEPLVADMARAFGSLLSAVLLRLFEPPRRLYARVNTLRADPGELLDSLRARGIPAFRDEHLEEAIYFPVEGPFQVEEVGARVYVDARAAESLMLGANLYRPGVLKSDPFRRGDLVTAISPTGRAVAVLRAEVDSRDLHGMSKGLVATSVRSLYRAPPLAELDEYKRGLIYPQSYPSMVVSRLLNPMPGNLVVDLNASPGGKTGHIVQLAKGRAFVVACDRSPDKVAKLNSTLLGLGLGKNVLTIPVDSRYLDLVTTLAGRADRVLIDPPCSDLGVRPKLAILKKYSDVRSLAEYQYQFLKVAAKLAKPGGMVVYSTCTITWLENEGNAHRAVAQLGLEPVDLGKIPRADRVVAGRLVAYRFHPLKEDMPGFFIVAFRKPSS